MICTQLLTLSLLVYITNSATRHFIGQFEVVLSDPVRIAFPIDQCVNYYAGLDGTLFGKFECNAQNDEVTFTKYGPDATCTTALTDTCDAAVCGPFTMTGKSAGDYQSFSCTGDDNYAEVNSCTATHPAGTLTLGDDGGIACCPTQLAASGDQNGGCLSQLQATDVCLELYGATGYTMTTCDNTTVITESFQDNTCTGASTLLSEQSPDYCSFYSKVDMVNYAVYRRQLKCVQAGYDIAPTDVYCPYETDPPTKAPTNNPTNNPTARPAKSETEANPDKGNMCGIIYGIVLVWFVGMFMQ